MEKKKAFYFLLWLGGEEGTFDSVSVLFYFLIIICVPPFEKYWLMNKTKNIACSSIAPCIKPLSRRAER